MEVQTPGGVSVISPDSQDVGAHHPFQESDHRPPHGVAPILRGRGGPGAPQYEVLSTTTKRPQLRWDYRHEHVEG